MPIQQLPPNVAAQIAAGEVVERPASVVKELVENALDAGAGRIAVAIGGGGVGEIRVTDDGCGIPAEELALAFRHHATSKLAVAADLETVTTLGFRGEALPSIAAVSRLVCTTRPAGAAAGARIEFRYGDCIGQRALGCAAGTTVQATGLFGNLPARRKFLRGDAAEAARVQEAVTRAALSHPGVRFTLTVDGREQFSSPGGGRLQDAILAVYGSAAAARMLPLHYADGDIVISGYTAAAELTRRNRSYITLLVNRRWVYQRGLAYAVEQAYRGQLPERRYPLAVVNIELPPEQVDVNSHPAKREVRFRNESRIFAAVQRAVSDALVAHSPARRAFASASGGKGDVPAGRAAVVGPAGPYDYGTGASAARAGDGGMSLSTTGLAPSPALNVALPGLRVVGQIRQTYVVAEGAEGMYLVDQHAAHERIIYDRIRSGADGGDGGTGGAERAAQPLLAPLPAELTLAQAATLQEYAGLLSDYGFVVEPFGDGGAAWLVRALPAALVKANHPDPAQALMELLDAVAVEQVVMAQEDALAATIACHGSVRAGMSLAAAEMDALLRQLESTPNPHHCPHGRPTVIHFTPYQLEREFGRR